MEILELATDLKGARDEINRLRADYALLADDYMQLLGDVERLRAELASWQEAFGLLTTLHGSMPVDISDPLRMAKSIEVHVRAELAEAKKFKDGMLDVLGGACPNDHKATPFDDFKGCTPCLRAELAEATAWRPISTAPTEGRILLWRAHATAPIVAKFDAIYGEFEDAFGDHVYGGTHWMPLPKAPKTGECIDAAMAGGE